MKHKMTTAFIAGAVHAITGTSLPVLATVSNTNAQNLVGEQKSTQLLAVELNNPEVTRRVRNLPTEIKLNIMKHMTKDTYEAVRDLWDLPPAGANERREMELNKIDSRLDAFMEQLLRGENNPIDPFN